MTDVNSWQSCLGLQLCNAWVQANCVCSVSLCLAGAVMFDVFKTWRLDSGDYCKVAELVVSAWEDRCREHGGGAGGHPQQRPALMHSNLSSVDHVKEVAK